ncbi:hypothetical protein A2165_00250 [Candidatus Curtissbacteria bacterium RBG_13_40_7]|uniref:Uncharacterized protein n=1 Tax=Candidatus Curtissbacteria bacterium RBG_13_40_7 TaxID=1797706 RepID=A0A1F5FWE4_9BACT|nr:MAG: hypothetical protein A2165_00250 [Candidatus Curtissbacteria bacterium RBG_13_40_7]
MTQFNLTKIKPLALASLVISIIVIILISFLIISSLKKDKPSQTETYKEPPIPTLKPTKLPQEEGFEPELSKIKSILPYTGKNFTIRYRGSINIITVEIKAQSREEFITTRKEVEAFLKSKGVSDLCSLNIFWQTPEGSTLHRLLGAKDLITSGCKP